MGINSVVILQLRIACFSQTPLSSKKNDDGQKIQKNEKKQTLEGIPFEVCFFEIKSVKNLVKSILLKIFEKFLVRKSGGKDSPKGVTEETMRH